MAELTASASLARGGSRRKQMSTRIDLTAMVDLAFLLITFFILTTTLSKPKSFNVVTPADGPSEPISENRTMTIVLGNDNKAVSYLGMTEKPITAPKVTDYGKDGLRQNIIELRKQVKANTGKDMFVIIKASDHSVYENFVTALDEMHISGTTGYAIVDITPKEVTLLKQKGVY